MLMNKQETILKVNDLNISFHTFAGEVKAIRGVNFELKKVRRLPLLENQALVNR